jgi:hypothetical protein
MLLTISEAAQLYHTWQRHREQGLRWTVGATIFSLAYVVWIVGGAPLSKPRDPSGWSHLVYGIGQMTGLLMMTASDVDVNEFLRENKPFALVFVVFILAVEVSFVYWGSICYLPQMLPTLYLAVRHRQVLDITRNYPKFTRLLFIYLLLNQTCSGFSIMFLSSHIEVGGIQGSIEGPPVALLLCSSILFVSSIAMISTYKWAKKVRGFSPTISLNCTIFVYLFGLGLSDLALRLSFVYAYHLHVPIPDLLYGPFLIVVPGLLLFFRVRVGRYLGRQWLKKRSQNEGTVFVGQSAERGGFEEVSDAIKTAAGASAASASLDAYIPAESEYTYDEYTLLIYAAANGHLDSVEKLLANGSIITHFSLWVHANVNLGSRSCAQSPLYFAAQNGHVEICRVLIEQGADVNQHDVNGFGPLYMACLKGHVACARVLIDAGAYAADFNQEILLVAHEKGHKDVVKLLIEEVGAKKTKAWMGLSATGLGIEDSMGSVEEMRRAISSTNTSRSNTYESSSTRDSGTDTDTDTGIVGYEDMEVLNASLLYDK